MPLRLNGAAGRPLGKTSLLLAGSCAFAASVACFTVLPSPAYRTHADVEIVTHSVPGPVTRISVDSARIAARLLLGEGVRAPSPRLLERLAVAAGRAQAEDGETRLAAEMLKRASLEGTTGDRLQVWSESRNARQAARVADALAEGLVASENRIVAHWREARARETADRLKARESEAAAAHARLQALTPASVETRSRGAVTNVQPAELRARLDMIRAILASGGAPLSDRRDVPPSIEGLQNNYLDLQRQLLKARQTLGDRHTTIINLQADLKKASAELLAEWQRLKRVTEAELKAARETDTQGTRVAPSAEGLPSADLLAARRAADIADQKLTEAVEAHQAFVSPGVAYRLASRAAVPDLSGGMAQWLRLLMSGAAGIFAFAALSGAMNRRDDSADAPLVEGDMESTAVLSEPLALEAETAIAESEASPLPEDEAQPSFWDVPKPQREILARRIMIATTERAVATLPYALGAAFAAIEIGLKVLIVETERDVPTLSAMAAKEEPQMFALDGRPRLVVRAEQGEGNLFIAPHLDGERPDAMVAETLRDVRQAFDVVVIDGGYFETVAASGWRAEAYQRVGHVTSDAVEESFAHAFGANAEQVLEPILVPAAEPPVRAEPPRRAAAHRSRRGLLAAESRRLGSPRRTAGGHR